MVTFMGAAKVSPLTIHSSSEYLRFTYLVLHELQRRGVVRILDGKDAVEDGLKSYVLPVFPVGYAFWRKFS